MTPKPKQIVIDKDAFMGIGLDSLCDFAKSHFLLLSDTLLYECTTAKKQRKKQTPQALVCRYEVLIRAGAYYCSMSRKFVEWECRQCQPYPWCLADFDETNNLRNGRRRIGDLLAPEITDSARDRRYRLAEVMLLRLSREIAAGASPDVAKQFKAFPADTISRLKKIQNEMGLNVRDWAVRYYAQWIADPVRFYPSREWMTWYDIYLREALRAEYVYLGQTSNIPSERRAEHDYQDMEYVLLLSRADGIITRDKKMVEPLALAAFPEKDVFSSLEEVPESYRCDWASP